MRIYKQTDRVEMKIGELTVKIKPLSFSEKQEIQGIALEAHANKDMKKAMESTLLAMKYAVKEIKGLENADGNEYQLQFEEDGKLTQECVEDLSNIEVSGTLINACSAFINGIPKEIEGVEFVKEKKPQARKSKK